MAFGDGTTLDDRPKRPAMAVPPPNIGAGNGGPAQLTKAGLDDVMNTVGTDKDPTLKAPANQGSATANIPGAGSAVSTNLPTTPIEKPTTAYDVGKTLRATTGNLADTVVQKGRDLANMGAVATDAITAPMRSVATGAVNLAQGFAGAAPTKFSDTPAVDSVNRPLAFPGIISAAAAAPASAAALPGAGATGAAGPIAPAPGSLTESASLGPTPPAAAIPGPAPVNMEANANAASAALNSTAPGTAVINGQIIPPDEIQRLNKPISGEAEARDPNSTYNRSVAENAAAVARPAQDPAAVAAWNAQVDREQAQRNSDSDVTSILNEDPRSPLGIAARNARVSLGDIRPAVSRYGGGGQSPYQEAITSLIQRASAPVLNAAGAEQGAAREAGEMNRAKIQQQTALADAAVRKPQPRNVTAADGSLHTVGDDNVARPVTDAQGNPFKEAQAKPQADDKAAAEQRAALAGTASKLLPDIAGLGKTPTADHIQQARLQAAQLHGLQTASNPKDNSRMVKIGDNWEPL